MPFSSASSSRKRPPDLGGSRLVQYPCPILLPLAGGGIAWIIRSRIEELRALEEKLHSDRRKTYEEILDPYIRLFAAIKNPSAQEGVNEQMLSLDYRKTAFQLILLGSDDVVRAHNELMQYIFSIEGLPDPGVLMKRYARLLLEIRKSLGNKRTTLREVDMLRGYIKDIDSFFPREEPSAIPPPAKRLP